jgi:tight adherence protein C
MTLVGIGALAVFGAASLLFLAAQDVLLQRMRVYRALRTIKASQLGPEDIGRSRLATPVSRRVLVPGLRRLGSVAKRMTPAGVVQRLARQLDYAGQPAGWDAERVLALKVFAAIGLAVFSLLLGLAGGYSILRAVLVTLLLATGGYFLPDLILHSRGSQRQEEIRRALPDGLDLLSLTVEAGLGFDAALARVARESGGSLGQELSRVLQEMQLGVSRSDALRGFSDRSTVAEVKSFVLSMVQADIFGISIAKVLQVQSHEMRVKRRQRAEERAQKLPVKILFPLLFCIFPALFVILLGPAAIRIYQSLITRI